MLDIKNTVTEAASQVSQRISRVATDALGAVTGSLSRAGLHVVDEVLAKASKLVGQPPGDAGEAAQATGTPAPAAFAPAPHGKAAAKRRKATRLAMQRLVKAAKRTASAARKN